MSLLGRDLFILMDSGIIRNRQSPISLTAAASLLAIALNKFTETERDFFIKYLLRAI